MELMYKIYKMKKHEPPQKIRLQIKKVIKEKEKILKPEVQKSIKKLRSIWKPIEKEFFHAVENITKRKWCYKYYVAYVSPFAQFNFYRGGTRYITLEAYIDLDRAAYTIAHELLHLHIYEILKEYKMPRDLRIKICEILVEFLSINERKLAKFWPKQKYILWCGLKSMRGKMEPRRIMKKLEKKYKEGVSFQELLEYTLSLV
jgi:predicted SprT family Zn-dependent metalloprotease